jgi:hypothetical protein
MEIDPQNRDEFQRKVPGETVKQLEIKMLPSFGLRTKEDAPAKALTPEERLIYADYLDSKGQTMGAASFRNYVETDEEKPTIYLCLVITARNQRLCIFTRNRNTV